jgi:TrmH family RNA methyltransferase
MVVKRMANMISITSAKNPLVKEIKSLKDSKGRHEKLLYFVEGVRLFEEAAKAGAEISYVAVSDDFASSQGYKRVAGLLNAGNYKMYHLPKNLFDGISDTDTPQGILAVIKLQKRPVSSVKDGEGLYIYLDEIRDPGNMGTIIRTADAAGFSGVIASKRCVDVYSPKVLRSTMGSVFHIPIYLCEDMETADAIGHLKSIGLKIYTAHVEGGHSVFDIDLTGRAVVVIGNEAFGAGRSAIEGADALVHIPMPGRAESINASVAAGIIMYESVRQREAAMQRHNMPL